MKETKREPKTTEAPSDRTDRSNRSQNGPTSSLKAHPARTEHPLERENNHHSIGTCGWATDRIRVKETHQTNTEAVSPTSRTNTETVSPTSRTNTEAVSPTSRTNTETVSKSDRSGRETNVSTDPTNTVEYHHETDGRSGDRQLERGQVEQSTKFGGSCTTDHRSFRDGNRRCTFNDQHSVAGSNEWNLTQVRIDSPASRDEREASAVARRVANPQSVEHRSTADRLESNEATIESLSGRYAPRIVTDVVSSSGRALDDPIKRRYESKIGGSFADVRIHTGPLAARAADALDARAFTVGNHIAFNRGQFAPNTVRGKHVIAHELTHVSQQRTEGVPTVQCMQLPGFGPPKKARKKQTLVGKAIKLRDDLTDAEKETVTTALTGIDQVLASKMVDAGWNVADIRSATDTLKRIKDKTTGSLDNTMPSLYMSLAIIFEEKGGPYVLSIIQQLDHLPAKVVGSMFNSNWPWEKIREIAPKLAGIDETVAAKIVSVETDPDAIPRYASVLNQINTEVAVNIVDRRWDRQQGTAAANALADLSPSIAKPLIWSGWDPSLLSLRRELQDPNSSITDDASSGHSNATIESLPSQAAHNSVISTFGTLGITGPLLHGVPPNAWNWLTPEFIQQSAKHRLRELRVLLASKPDEPEFVRWLSLYAERGEANTFDLSTEERTTILETLEQPQDVDTQRRIADEIEREVLLLRSNGLHESVSRLREYVGKSNQYNPDARRGTVTQRISKLDNAIRTINEWAPNRPRTVYRVDSYPDSIPIPYGSTITDGDIVSNPGYLSTAAQRDHIIGHRPSFQAKTKRVYHVIHTISGVPAVEPDHGYHSNVSESIEERAGNAEVVIPRNTPFEVVTIRTVTQPDVTKVYVVLEERPGKTPTKDMYDGSPKST